ncbi:MAG: exonuclease domain-containing protein [Candidatus Sericytochromatia bacterium]
MNTLDKKLEELNFVFFDLETTGLFPVSSKIIEIGAVKFNFSEGVLATFETLIDPEVTISKESIQIHGITDDMVKGKPFINDILPNFFEFIKDCIVIAHNSDFDASFISYNINRYNFENPPNLIIDTIPLAKKYIKSCENYKLSNLVKFLKLDVTEYKSKKFHRALFDSECGMNIFKAIVERQAQKEKTPFGQLLLGCKIKSFAKAFKSETPEEIPESLSMIKEEIGKNSKINIIYKRVDGELTKRDITPLAFIKVNGKLYLEAFCYLRKEKRSFRLNKIIDCKLVSNE